jgi:hypothetical protein
MFGVIIEALGIALAAPGVLWRVMFGPKKPQPGKKPAKPKRRR